MYADFERRAVRALLIGTALSIIPGVAFFALAFSYTLRQLSIVCILAALDIAAFIPVDVFLLRLTLRPARDAFAPGATLVQKRLGLARLLDSPRFVLIRVFAPHALIFSAGITILVLVANRYFGLGIPTAELPLYWFLALTVIPIAHAVYEFAWVEDNIQPLASILAREINVRDCGARPFTLTHRLRIFGPLLMLAPVVIVATSIFLRTRDELGPKALPLLRNVALIAVICAVLFLFLMYTLGRQLHDQTAAVTTALDRLSYGEMETRAELFTASEFGAIASHINDTAVSLRERQRLRDLFGAYMTSEVADALLDDHGAGRTETRFVAILFLDVRGFTAFSSNRSPQQVVDVLNEIFAVAVDAIASNGGTVNKYLGDGFLAVFGAPVPLTEPCRAAVAAALEISNSMRALNARWVSAGMAALGIGIGIHAGEVVVGSVGSPDHKLEYTVIGDAVNVASRIEQLNKNLGTEILVSDVVYRAAGDLQRHAGPAVSELIKGIAEAVTVYPISATLSIAAR